MITPATIIRTKRSRNPLPAEQQIDEQTDDERDVPGSVLGEHEAGDP